MRIVHVNNVGSTIGGTGACARDIALSLPEWQHRMLCCGVKAEQFPGMEIVETEDVTEDNIWDAEIVIWHNTPAYRIPQTRRPGQAWIYFVHSLGGSGFRGRDMDAVMVCSRFLCREMGLPETWAVSQPTLIPPKDREKPNQFTVGKIATPIPIKWIEQLFTHIPQRVLTECDFEFAGATRRFVDALLPSHPNWRFHAPSPDARKLLWGWHVAVFNGDFREPYGRVVCECQRAGVIPIVWSNDGMAEQVRHGVDGFVIEFSDDCWDIVDRLNHDRELCHRMSEVAAASGHQRGSSTAFRQVFAGLLAKATGRPDISRVAHAQ